MVVLHQRWDAWTEPIFFKKIVCCTSLYVLRRQFDGIFRIANHVT